MPTSKRSLTVADYLLQIKAIQLQPQNPFQWSSGWYAPIYCDNRKVLAYPTIRKNIINAFIEEFHTRYNEDEINCIAGVATSGIPFGTLIADQLYLPFTYVRSSSKNYGLGHQIEGERADKKDVLLIEDLISTGQSSLDALHTLEQHNYNVVEVGAIFSYQLALAQQNFSEADHTFFSLSNFEALLEKALTLGIINEDLLQTLQNWREDPEQWSKNHAPS